MRVQSCFTEKFDILELWHISIVVCPLDHPTAEESPFAKAVSKRAEAGGGWMTWVVAYPNQRYLTLNQD